MVRFANVAKPLLSYAYPSSGPRSFPWSFRPSEEDGLGVILLNSNADTHFSFTNALGMVSAEQVHGLEIATKQYPRACWIIALHHHAVEYPRPAKALSERIGTALINGNWFVRKMQPLAGKRDPDAWPPAHRLDRPLRRAGGGFGAVPGHGGHRRQGRPPSISIPSPSALTDA